MIKKLAALLLALLLLSGCAGAEAVDLTGFRVCIDPGHQARMDGRLEPVFPGGTEYKARVAGGAMGVVTHARESAVNLEIALELRDHLESLGAEVLLVRESEDVQISNVQRANMASLFQADVFLRLHCNSSKNEKNRGFRIYAPRRAAALNYGADEGQMLAWGETLCDFLLEYTEQTIAHAYVSDQYSGSNWAQMPTFLIEMGYMTNPMDDRLLQDATYRQGVARAIAAFIQTLPKDACRDTRAYENPLLVNMKHETKAVIVYEAPDEASAQLAKVNARYRFYALNDEGDGWYLVLTQKGVIGYVRSDGLVECLNQ